MARKRSYFSKSNKGQAASVFLHNWGVEREKAKKQAQKDAQRQKREEERERKASIREAKKQEERVARDAKQREEKLKREQQKKQQQEKLKQQKFKEKLNTYVNRVKLELRIWKFFLDRKHQKMLRSGN